MVNYNMSVNKLSIFVDLLIVNEVELFIVQFCFYFLNCWSLVLPFPRYSIRFQYLQLKARSF